MLEVGSVAPLFAARTQDGKTVRLEDYRGQNHVVLFFFPKDSTPG